MSGTQFIAIAALTWLLGLLFFLKMVLRPVTDTEWKWYRNSTGPWFWIELFGGDRTRENLTRFFQRTGAVALAVWVLILLVVVTFGDWPAIVAMEKLQ